MSEIPEDIRKAAKDALQEWHADPQGRLLVEVVAKAILAERQRCWSIADKLAGKHSSREADWVAMEILDGSLPSGEILHSDDMAVDRFAASLKAKLAEKRAQGYGGWDNPEECSIKHLSGLLRDHVVKGDPVDVGNFCMMIQQRGGRIA